MSMCNYVVYDECDDVLGVFVYYTDAILFLRSLLEECEPYPGETEYKIKKVRVIDSTDIRNVYKKNN